LTQYPHYAEWLTWMSQRENGLLLVAVIAVAGIIWLFNVRQIAPKFLPAFSKIALGLFYLSAIVLLLAPR
jgi:hypothetical protein